MFFTVIFLSISFHIYFLCLDPCQDVSCEFGTCVNGECVRGCSPPLIGCGPLETCFNGICVDRCVSQNITCPSGQICSNGFCIPSCITTTCSPGLTCMDGKCVESCNGVTCELLQECIDGECVNTANNPCNNIDCQELEPFVASSASRMNGCVADLDTNLNIIPNCCGSTREIFNGCGSGCGEQTCNDIVNPPPFPVICPAVCIDGCFCKPGYTRSSQNGECIPTFECFSQ
mmetsp:Transcript_88320/g.108132  ORF Transcript_88320/g.108132 Transcript_88320/m.108132 type:complete len:231 (+) Transcript_88320:156-848(+)